MNSDLMMAKRRLLIGLENRLPVTKKAWRERIASGQRPFRMAFHSTSLAFKTTLGVFGALIMTTDEDIPIQWTCKVIEILVAWAILNKATVDDSSFITAFPMQSGWDHEHAFAGREDGTVYFRNMAMMLNDCQYGPRGDLIYGPGIEVPMRVLLPIMRANDDYDEINLRRCVD